MYNISSFESFVLLFFLGIDIGIFVWWVFKYTRLFGFEGEVEYVPPKNLHMTQTEESFLEAASIFENKKEVDKILHLYEGRIEKYLY